MTERAVSLAVAALLVAGCSGRDACDPDERIGACDAVASGGTCTEVFGDTDWEGNPPQVSCSMGGRQWVDACPGAGRVASCSGGAQCPRDAISYYESYPGDLALEEARCREYDRTWTTY